MKWLVLAAAALAILLSGCSGLSYLMVRNSSGEDLAITVLSSDVHRGETYDKQILAGEEIETLHWVGKAPDWIKVAAKDASGRSREHKWVHNDYPPEMKEGSNLSVFYVLEVNANEMILRDPTRWDAIRRNPLGYGLLVLWPLGVVVGIVLAIRKRAVTTG